MNLNLVIGQIRTYAPIFNGRVAGAARYKALAETANLLVPAAYVVPLDDSPGDNQSLNDVWQPLTDSFAVIVAIDNTVDERGQAAIEIGHDTVRAQLWACLLGWQPDGLGSASRYRGIVYQGGNLLDLDRSRLWYQFDFGADMQIVDSDGWQETELAAYPHFDGVTVNWDAIDPEYDKNLVAAGAQGPDGRAEHVLHIPKTGNLP
ncbi:conserved hypothetical protein [Gammaproteobacteria bacterium]